MSTLKLFVCYLQYFVSSAHNLTIYRSRNLSFSIMKTGPSLPDHFLFLKYVRFLFLIGSSEPSTQPVSVKLSTLSTALPSSLPLIRKPVSIRAADRHSAESRPHRSRLSFPADAAAAPAPTAARKLMSELTYPSEERAAPSEAYSTAPHRSSAAAQMPHAAKARARKEKFHELFCVSDKKTLPIRTQKHPRPI